MANPFDEFDEFEANPFDEFDEKPKKKKGSTFLENAAGTAAAAGDIAAGLVKIPLQFGLAAGGKMVEPGASLDSHRQAGQEAVEDLFPSIGKSIGGADTDAYRTIMKPFELLGEGIDWIGDKAGELTGSKDVAGATKLGIDFGSVAAGIPGTRMAGRAGAKVVEALDPGVRDAGKAKVSEMEVQRKQAEIDAQKAAEAKAKEANPFDEFDKANETRQMELFDLDNQGKAANKYEAQEGTWRVDENGMPVRVDISMEAQNLQTPLQRGLWGDELPPRETPRGQSDTLPMDRDILGHEKLTQPDRTPDQIGITQAMDNTRAAGERATELPEAMQKWEELKAQTDRLSHDVHANGELLSALLDADIAQGGKPRSSHTDPVINKPSTKKQAGAAARTPLEQVGQIATKGLEKTGEALEKVYEATGRLPIAPEQRIPTKAETDLAAVLKADARTHIGGMFKAPEFKPEVRPTPPLKQRGAVGNLSGNKKKRTIIDDFKDRYKDVAVPDDPVPANTIKEALTEGKDSKQWKYTESGATLAAMKRGSAIVRDAGRIVQNHLKKADLMIRKNVFPVEKAFRALSRDEITSLSAIMKAEMLQGKRFDPAALESLSVKQQVAYAHMRHMFEDTLRIQNEARAAKGEKPIDEMEAYLSSRWSGDFRRPVFQAVLDKSGNPVIEADGSIKRKLVWYLAAHSKKGLDAQFKELKKQHPDLEFDPKEDHVVRFYKRQTDLQSVYTTLLDILGRDDPAVAKIENAVRQQAVNEAATFLGQEKHFKEKTGVRGFVGDRPGREGVNEALAMFQQQIQYAKNAYKWSELQKAAQPIKELVSNKDLVQQQPNNVQYVKEYFKNNVGYGEAKAVAHVEDALRDLGVSPTVVDAGVSATKSYFILQKLAVNTGYTIANLLQTVNVMPHLVALHGQGVHGNVLKAIPVGISGGIAMALGHYISFAGLGQRGKLFTNLPEAAFINKAFKYAEDNGVTARSLYDEAPIETSFSVVGRTANALGKTMTIPETFVRSMSYMTFVQFLKDSKKFKSDMEIFQRAEELTNAAMVDYRAGERPMVFAKLGTVGNFLNTLQTYPVNWYNQWNYFAREALKGNVSPFVAAFGLQYAMAGMQGIPGFSDMEKLYHYFKDEVVSDKMYVKMRESDFWNDPKMWMVKNFGQPSVYGVISDKSGIGITSRISAPGMGDMIQAPGGPIADIAKQASSTLSAVANPTNTTKAAQAGMQVVPPGVQGLLEQAPFMEGKTFDVNKETGERIYKRPGAIEDHAGIVQRGKINSDWFGEMDEETIRNFGLRSQREVVEREAGYRLDRANTVAGNRARSIPDAFYDAIKRGDKEKARDLQEAYVKLTGNEISSEMIEAQIERNYKTTYQNAASRAESARASVMAVKEVARMKALLKEINDEYKSGRPAEAGSEGR